MNDHGEKTIDTLVEDIYSVISGKGGWDNAVNEYFLGNLGETMMSRLGEPKEERPKGLLRMSSIGQPCSRKLWYSTNSSEEGEDFEPSTLLKFIYGDLLEDFILALAVAAGHKVEGRQDELTIEGIKGHRDAVIDGVTIDVKTASTYSFKKFEKHNLEKEDPFGYLTQLGSYVLAGKDDPLVKDKKGGAFLAMDKQHGHLCLDYYDFEKSGMLRGLPVLYQKRKDLVVKAEPPYRTFSDIPEGSSGNKKLDINCSYCNFKSLCWPGLRTFLYKQKDGFRPVYLTSVTKTPRVMEV